MMRIPGLILLAFLCTPIFAQSNSYSKKLIFDSHLKYSINEHTLDSLKMPLHGFYDNLDLDGEFLSHKYWIASDFENTSTPYMYLLSLFYIRGSGIIQPYVMSITPDSVSNDYIARIAYLLCDSTHGIDHIYIVILSKDSSGVYKLKDPIEYLTKNWNKYQLGSIKYIINPDRNFNIAEAQKMDSFNTRIAKYFNTNTIQIKYYSCGSYKQFWYIQGEDNFFMTGNYDTMVGGRADPNSNTIFSGNNSEYYPHELVHIYLTNLVKPETIATSTLAHEGICTYLGGSVNQDFNTHLKVLWNYIEENNIQVPLDLLNLPGGMIGDTEITYAIGGIFAKLVDSARGYRGIIEMANVSDEEFYSFIAKTLKIKESSINGLLMKELQKYD